MARILAIVADVAMVGLATGIATGVTVGVAFGIVKIVIASTGDGASAAQNLGRDLLALRARVDRLDHEVRMLRNHQTPAVAAETACDA